MIVKLVEGGEEGDEEGKASYFKWPSMNGLPIGLKNLDLGSYTKVVDDPVDKIANPIGNLKESIESFLPSEHQFLDRLILIHTLKYPKQFPRLPNRFSDMAICTKEGRVYQMLVLALCPVVRSQQSWHILEYLAQLVSAL